MTYKFNGTDLTLQPTKGRWMPKTVLGTDGNGHPIYSALREFDMTWQLISPADFNQILLIYNNAVTVNTVVVELPQFNSSSYAFYGYTGCVLHEPEIAEYFNENLMNAILIITGIRT